MAGRDCIDPERASKRNITFIEGKLIRKIDLEQLRRQINGRIRRYREMLCIEFSLFSMAALQIFLENVLGPLKSDIFILRNLVRLNKKIIVFC